MEIISSVVRDAGLPTRFVLKNVRIGYAHGLNEATSMSNSDGGLSAPKYSCVVLIPDTETETLKQVNTVLWEACSRQFGQGATAMWTQMQAANRLCLRSGAAKATQEGFLGSHFISASAKLASPPLLFGKYLNEQGTGPEQLTRPQNVIYSGCYVNIQLNVWVQDHKSYGQRVNAEILAVQFAADGESFGGGAAADAAMFSAAPRPAGDIGGAPPAAPSFAPPAAPSFAPPAAPAAAPPAAPPAAAQAFAPPPAAAAPAFAPPAAPAPAAPQGFAI